MILCALVVNGFHMKLQKLSHADGMELLKSGTNYTTDQLNFVATRYRSPIFFFYNMKHDVCVYTDVNAQY